MSQPRRAYVPFLAGLFNLARLPSEARLTALRQYSKKLAERCNLVQENWRKAKIRGDIPWHAELMFDYSLTMTEAELNWIKHLVESMAKGKKGDGNEQNIT